MTLHGNVLNSEEAGELAAIIDRDAISTGDRNHEWFELNECNAERCPVCKADYASIADRSRLLEFHHRLAARVAELEAELAGTPPTLEWLRRQFGKPDEENRHGALWTNPPVLVLNGVASSGRHVYPTRAAVLAAVAAAKGEA